MGPFDLDYSHVKNVVAPDRVPVAGNEHRMVRVAFDFFRLDGDENECLWQVQADDDGNEFLVRTYDMPDESDNSLEARAADWSVMLDTKKANLTIAYKGVPIHRLAAADYGAHHPDDVRLFRDMVSEKLAADEQWADRLLHSLPAPKLAALSETFPELSKISADEQVSSSLTEKLQDYYARTSKALKEQGGYESLSESQQELFNEIADMLMDIKLSGGGDLKRLEDFVARFEEASHFGHLDQVGKIAEIAKEMGHGGTFEKHELPMVVFYFREGNEKAKEFLERTEQAGFGAGMLVGPGYAAVRIPTGW